MSVSRRQFIRTSGSLVVSFSAASLLGSSVLAQGPFDTHRSHIDPDKLDSWVAVAGDGTVTGYSGKCDFGQGMLTAQTQLVAEELCVSLDSVKIVQCDTAVSPDQGTTSGSQSTPTNFNLRNLAQAAATAREALIAMAAKQLGEPVEQLTAVEATIIGKSGRRLSYAQLIGNKQFNLPMNVGAKRRSPEQWTILGKSIPSLDRSALMTGRFEFVHNVRVPGMLHGRVVRPPEVGATVSSVDEGSVRSIPGLIKIVVRRNFVGVVAEKQWSAIQAAQQLNVVWTPGRGLSPQETYYDELRKQPSEDTLIVDSRDVEQQLGKGGMILRSTYMHPYQMHGSAGTSCAVADVKGERATLWSATQSVYPTRSIVSKILALPLDNVRVVFVRGSGCYGLNGADTVTFDAALLSEAVQRPVRVQLSRQDEMAWENFGSAFVIDQRAAVDKEGAIIAWECETWEASRGSRPGYDQPGNVITGTLLGYDPETNTPKPASEPKEQLHNRGNVVPSYFAGCVGGQCGGAGKIRSERVLTHEVNSPFFTGPLRSPRRLQNTFAHECFMDEIAARMKTDPVSLRLNHLRDERLIAVLKEAAKAAAWEHRHSPVSTMRRTGIARGRGIACVAYEGDNGYAALVSEVDVDLDSGKVRPRRFVVAIDSGPISNPDGLRNQTEGGILQGASRALGEQVSWDSKRITSIDWETYNSLYLDLETPQIEVVLVNRKDVPALGAGETAITLSAASLGNAIFDATGLRLREIPFSPERVRAALRKSATQEKVS